jgi:Tol biopolymer transport system component
MKYLTCREKKAYSLAASLLFCSAVALAPQHALTQTTERVSVSSSGAQANGSSFGAAISPDGRFVAFVSTATNLVLEDTNGYYDIFVHDRLTGATERVSVSSAGVQANGHSLKPSLSADGRFVAFESYASNLVPNDTNNEQDIFVRDRLTGATERVSVSSAGVQADRYSFIPSLSADGRFVTFYSNASTLVTGTTMHIWSQFLHDRLTRRTVKVSGDGHVEYFQEDGNRISADGRYVTYADLNATLWLWDRVTGVSEAVYTESSLYAINLFPRISADGHSILYDKIETDYHESGFPDEYYSTFLLDLRTRERYLLDGSTYNRSSLSGNGVYATIVSYLPLVTEDTNNHLDIYLWNRYTQALQLVSLSSSGAQANGTSEQASLSADGRFIAFRSFAANLVSGDTNNAWDIFVRGPLPGVNPGAFGVLTLQGIADNAAPQYLTFTFRRMNGPDIVRTESILPNGVFVLPDLPPNLYVMHISGLRYLSANVMVDLRNGSVADLRPTLRPGDANNDNACDVYDLHLLILSFNFCEGEGNFLSGADFNGDGCVDVFDLDLLIRNFNAVGDD